MKPRRDRRRPTDGWWIRLEGFAPVRVEAAGRSKARWAAAKACAEAGYFRSASDALKAVVEVWSEKRWPQRHLKGIAA